MFGSSRTGIRPKYWTMRKVLAPVAAVLVALLLAACTPEESDAVVQVNAFREANALAPFAWEEGAYAKARAWSEKMADDGHLSHSKLSDGVPGGWKTLGENVAYAGSVDGALRALERSPGHRANLLNPRYDRIAIGIIERNGTFWVTQVFLG